MAEITTTTHATKQIEAVGGVPAEAIPVTIKKGLNLAKGTVLGRITASGLYGAYNDGNSDGTEVASGILAYGVNASTTGEDRDVDAAMFICGAFYEDQLTGIDANGKTDLNGRTIPGRNIFIF